MILVMRRMAPSAVLRQALLQCQAGAPHVRTGRALARNRCNLVVRKSLLAQIFCQASPILWRTGPGLPLHNEAPKKVMMACG